MNWISHNYLIFHVLQSELSATIEIKSAENLAKGISDGLLAVEAAVFAFVNQVYVEGAEPLMERSQAMVGKGFPNYLEVRSEPQKEKAKGLLFLVDRI